MDPLFVAAEERLGRVLTSKWRLDRLLGIGGMAAVYEATHKNGKRVAVKMLHASLGAVPAAKERFLHEAYAANAVHHPGVVSVLDDGETQEGEIFLLMELLEGETLEARWTRSAQRLPLAEVLATADALLDVLAAAHAAGVVHRDVKPENVFVTHEGAVKVLDFGIAYVRELSTSDRRTQTGTTMGTPAFMAPEQARGRWDEVDARSDVWAVGAVMFSLLAGRCVHEGETTNEVLLAAMTQQAPPLAEVCPAAPPAVAWVVDRALAFEREARWPDAAAMLSALRDAVHDRLELPAPAASTEGLTLPLRRRSPALLAATATALALAAFAAVFLLVPRASRSASLPVGVVSSAATPTSPVLLVVPPPDPALAADPPPPTPPPRVTPPPSPRAPATHAPVPAPARALDPLAARR